MPPEEEDRYRKAMRLAGRENFSGWIRDIILAETERIEKKHGRRKKKEPFG
jgi:hypothetical protein